MKKVITCIASIILLCGIGLGFYKFHPHKYNMVDSKESTCTEQGSKTYKCWCGNSYTDSIGPTGHDYEETITEPTCIEKGLKTYSCKKCGDVYTEEIEETGHNYQEEITEPSCVEGGVKTYTCINCGDIYTETIDKLGLDDSEGNAIEAIVKDGKVTYVGKENKEVDTDGKLLEKKAEPTKDTKTNKDNSNTKNQDNKTTIPAKEGSEGATQPTQQENAQAENSTPNVESYMPTDNSAEAGAALWGCAALSGSWEDMVSSVDTSNPYGLGVE